jgi:hypothetical protein
MASLSTERNSRKLFSGDKEGPPLRHLKQMHAGQDVGIKLRPTAVNFTPSDRFVLLTDLLEGGARSQADQLQERMQKELDASNALELMEYDAAVAAYPIRMAEWNALPAEGRGAAPVQPAAIPPVAKTLFQDPVGHLWESFGRLYLDRSSSRIEEYRDFKSLPGEFPIW